MSTTCTRLISPPAISSSRMNLTKHASDRGNAYPTLVARTGLKAGNGSIRKRWPRTSVKAGGASMAVSVSWNIVKRMSKRQQSCGEDSYENSLGFQGCCRDLCWNWVTRSPAFREYRVRPRGQLADRWMFWQASA